MTMHDNGFRSGMVVQGGEGFSLAECATDKELWFAVTIQFPPSAPPTNGGAGLTFGAADYSQQPPAFPMPQKAFLTISAVEIKTVGASVGCNRVLSFIGQVPKGMRFAVSNDTDTEFTLSIGWSPRKITG